MFGFFSGLSVWLNQSLVARQSINTLSNNFQKAIELDNPAIQKYIRELCGDLVLITASPLTAVYFGFKSLQNFYDGFVLKGIQKALKVLPKVV